MELEKIWIQTLSRHYSTYAAENHETSFSRADAHAEIRTKNLRNMSRKPSMQTVFDKVGLCV
jgi:hypothetical protein